jgi:hypothetical protein|tara:strand:- start:167 stop:367 length:201 start_codon:yes stop_codon:yes gene_type:complete
MKTIDITPTWTSIIIPMIEVLKNPKASAESQKIVADEMVRLAQFVDKANEQDFNPYKVDKEAKKNG